MILTSLQKGKAMRLPNSDLKPISRYHLRVVVGAGGRGRGRGCVFAEAAQTPNRGSSTQIGSSQASQATAQSNQSTQEQVRSSIGSEYGGEYGGSQDTTASALLSVGGNIQRAYRGRGTLPFQQDFAEGSFGAFRL